MTNKKQTRKSYLNESNSIISEGALGVLSGMLAAGHFVKFLKYLKRFSPKMKADINNLNKNVSTLEKHFEKEFGKKMEFDRFKLTDFIKTAKF